MVENVSRYEELTDLDQATLIDRYAPPSDVDSWLRINMVSSIDGAVEVDGASHQLSSADDMRVFKVLRMLCDVLITGAGTVRADGYRPVKMASERLEWRRAHGRSDHPTMAVVTRDANLALDAPLFTASPVPPIVITCAAAPKERRDALSRVAQVLVAGDETVDFAQAQQHLHDSGLTQQLCEGGPHILGELTAADLIDEMCFTLSPTMAGAGSGRITAGPRSPLRHMDLAHIIHANGNLLLRYTRARETA